MTDEYNRLTLAIFDTVRELGGAAEWSEEIVPAIKQLVTVERERLEVVRADLVNETVARLKAVRERDAAVLRAEVAKRSSAILDELARLRGPVTALVESEYASLTAENRLLRDVADAAERLSKRVPGSTMGELDAALVRLREHREGQA